MKQRRKPPGRPSIGYHCKEMPAPLTVSSLKTFASCESAYGIITARAHLYTIAVKVPGRHATHKILPIILFSHP